jgi:hypothetical protein
MKRTPVRVVSMPTKAPERILGAYYPGKGLLILRPITSVRTLETRYHELGHAFEDKGGRPQPHDLIRSWARENARAQADGGPVPSEAELTRAMGRLRLPWGWAARAAWLQRSLIASLEDPGIRRLVRR